MRACMVALLTCSVSMTVLALCYMALTPILAKRYAERGRYYAWLIIVIGLIVPFRPDFGSAIVDLAVQNETAMPLIRIGDGMPIIIPIRNGVLAPSTLNISYWQAALMVWFIGVVAFLAYHMIQHYQIVKLTARWSEPIKDPKVLEAFRSLKAEMGIFKKIDLCLCSSIGSPMMIGFSRPRILLPKVDFAEDERRFILKHELVHFQRKDLWYKCLVLLASAIHWFNPIVYFMAKAIDTLCEISCDAEVVKRVDVNVRRQYSEAIIGVVRHRSMLRTALTTNFNGGKEGMKKRIFTILDTNKKKTGASIICIALLATVGTGFAFASSAGSPANVLPEANVASVEVGADVLRDYEIYTYDEYAKYVDEQRIVLQELLGSPEWPRERVDRVNRIYDDNLDGLKNGTLSFVKPSYENEASGAVGSTSHVGRVGEVFAAAVCDPKTGETISLGEFSTEQEANDAVTAYLKKK